MANPDLKKAHEALQALKEKPESLALFSSSLDAFRASMAEEINDETFHYVVNTLVSQRVTDRQKEFMPEEARLTNGFRILAAIKVASDGVYGVNN